MQSLSPGVRRGVALAALLLMLAAPAVYADEPVPTDPQGRIHPPTGVTSQQPSWFELLTEWLRAQVRINPRTG